MDIVKKNLLAIFCGVVALVSVIVIFFPLKGMYAGLTAEVQKSKGVGDSIAALTKTSRNWPSLGGGAEEVISLKRFPNAATVEAGRKMTESWTSETQQFLNRAIGLQQANLTLLVPDTLPLTRGQSIAFEFMDLYRKMYRLSDRTAPGGRAPVAVNKDYEPSKVLGTPLIGTLPPLDVDIAAEAKRRVDTIRANDTRTANGKITNAEEIAKSSKQAQEDTWTGMRTERATKAMVYLKPEDAFQYNRQIQGSVAPSTNEIFDAQVGLWLQQEICRAIYETNRGSTRGILDAPVKRLIGIRFPTPLYASGRPGAAAAAAAVPVAGAGPTLPPMNETTKVPVDFTKNPLGQISNEFYDVLPFQMNIICRADMLPETITGLSRNRYIAFRVVSVQALDSSIEAAKGFIYGDAPVVYVALQGQYLMLRRVLGPLMPPDVVNGLNNASQMPAPGAPGPATPDGMSLDGTRS